MVVVEWYKTTGALQVYEMEANDLKLVQDSEKIEVGRTEEEVRWDMKERRIILGVTVILSVNPPSRFEMHPLYPSLPLFPLPFLPPSFRVSSAGRSVPRTMSSDTSQRVTTKV